MDNNNNNNNNILNNIKSKNNNINTNIQKNINSSKKNFFHLPPPKNSPLDEEEQKEYIKSSNISSLKTTLETNLSLYQQLTQTNKHKQTTSAPHSNWKLYRLISGHNGWVRCIDVDPTNNFFVTGSNDCVLKFWDLPTGTLKLSLTGHINSIRKVVISNRHPYLFSCSEDRTIKCWDLEQNKVIRHYHGHLSGVYSISLHPAIDILASGGRDCVGRIWDLRTRQQIMSLNGHSNTICSIACQVNDPQVITGSNDCSVKIWDLRNGKCLNTMTHHKKSIRNILIPDFEYTFITAGCDNIKVWKCPEGRFLRNISGHNGIVNGIALNQDGVFASAAEDGTIFMWDYKSGEIFQKINVKVQPGSLESEVGIFDVVFDKTGTRMISVGVDKSIKMWKEDVNDEEDE